MHNSVKETEEWNRLLAENPIHGPWDFWKDDDLCIFCGAYVDEDANEDCSRSWIHRCDGKSPVSVEKRWNDDKDEI